MNKKRRGLAIYSALVMAYLFIPIAVMIAFGFNDYRGKFNLTWERFTLEHYTSIGDYPELLAAYRNSLVLAAVSTLIATILGTLIALALTRYNFKGRGALNLFIFLPMATPEVVLGVALLALFVTTNLERGFVTLVIAHVMFSVSYVVVTVKARTSGFDRSLEDAAQDLGATPWTSFWTVTFPLILPGIVAAGALAFVLSIDDYVISSFNSGATVTGPLWIYGASRFELPAQVNVVGTLTFLVGVGYVLISLYRQREKSQPVTVSQ
jgi:spermidine/putrescine transport system permease protein